MASRVLEKAAARHVLGILRSDEIPEIAAEALAAGYDTSALRRIAGMRDAHERVFSLFEDALSEASIQRPSRAAALKMLVREIAEQILDGRLSPGDGAKQIWKLSIPFDEHFQELDTFIYGASEWDDRPEDRHLLSDGIIRAARDLIEVPEPEDRPPR